MLNKTIRILNFDDSILKQARLISKYQPEIINLKNLGPRVRLWMDRAGKDEIESHLKGNAKNSITFLGSGDFHHISHILISQFKEPFSLIIFDFHPDWDTLPPRFGCGSWVTQVLKNKNILKCVLIGASSSDISSWRVESGNLSTLKDSRLEIYPYSHKPSCVFLRQVPQNRSMSLKKCPWGSKIYWNELKGKNLNEFCSSFLKRLPTKKVYVSLDKDCLSNKYALTNWEEGFLSLEELLIMLKLIKENKDIIGMDIVGDYSPVLIDSVFKKVLSYFDHPRDVKSKILSEASITTLNEETNLKILELFDR